ncbi:MAG: hypothetical protein ACREA3_01960, partial [Nitrosotalea sp.]
MGFTGSVAKLTLIVPPFVGFTTGSAYAGNMMIDASINMLKYIDSFLLGAKAVPFILYLVVY